MACPASVLDGGLRVDPVNEAGNVGSAAHEALRALVETGAVEWERIGEIAANHGADEQEVRMLCAQGTRLWRGIAGSFPAAVTEHGPPEHAPRRVVPPVHRPEPPDPLRHVDRADVRPIRPFAEELS